MKLEMSGFKEGMSCLEEENTQLKLAKKLFDLEKANFEVCPAVCI